MGAKAEEFRANARRLEERADVALEERIRWLCLAWPSAGAMILNATSLTKLLHGCRKQTLPIRPVASFIADIARGIHELAKSRFVTGVRSISSPATGECRRLT